MNKGTQRIVLGGAAVALTVIALGAILATQEGSMKTGTPTPQATPEDSAKTTDAANTEQATFGAGCFWCVEAVFDRLPGVLNVESGYSGGKTPDPTYKQVCSGRTGHAEVVRITYDPSQVAYEQLLDLFWRMHDPTTLNRQGADVGSQYRSVVFYHNDAQREAAETMKRKLDQSDTFDDPIVTEISPAAEFYPAEDYHQDYFENNRNAPYCRIVIAPKLRKLDMDE